MDVGKALDVEAAFAGGVFAKLCEKVFLPVVAEHQVKNDVLFARRERDEHPVGFFAAGVDAAMMAEADDAGAPHHRLFLRGNLHDGGNSPAISAELSVLNGSEETGGGFCSFLCFGFGHDGSPESLKTQRLFDGGKPLNAVDAFGHFDFRLGFSVVWVVGQQLASGGTS